MKLYFYTHVNMMFDYLARNIIAPNALVRDIKGYQTISTAVDQFLFITHKKLDWNSRTQGIVNPEMVYPITLELTDILEGDHKAVLVEKKNDAYSYVLDSLKNYSAEKHVGAYLSGEIPLSRVEKIRFDKKEEQETFFRASQDYWYPENKYALLSEDFSEAFTMPAEVEKVIDAFGAPSDVIIKGIERRERQRAAVLNYVNGTKDWQYGKFMFNIDQSLQNFFGLDTEALAAVMPNYKEAEKEKNHESLVLINPTQDGETDFNQQLYNRITEILIQQPFQTGRQAEDLVPMLDEIAAEDKNKKELQRAVSDIRELITGNGGKTPESVIASIPESIGIMKALVFVAKNPGNYDLFQSSLEAYHADLLTGRRAAVLWGFLNGLYGMPGEGFNKDNQELWQFIEAYAYKQAGDNAPTLSVSMPEPAIVEGAVFGIALKEEQIITAEEVRAAILKLPKERLTDVFYKKLYEAAEADLGSKKGAKKEYTIRIASEDLPAIKKDDIIDDATYKTLERILKACKNPVNNEKKLFKDYVDDAEKFAFVFNRDSDYWKRAYLVLIVYFGGKAHLSRLNSPPLTAI